MGIEIHGSLGSPPVELNDQTTRRTAETDKGPAQTSSAAARQGSRDTLNLTDTATQLRAIESQIADQPEVDQQRVAEVRQAFAIGSHNIDPRKVADSMLSFELGLSGDP